MNSEKISNKLVLLIVVTVAFYGIILLFADFNLLVEGISNFNFQYLPAILALMAAHTIILAIKFHRLAQKSGIHLPFLENLKIYIAGLSLGITPGGIGTAIKSQLLKNKVGKSISSTLPIIVLERWTELLGILILTTTLLIWSDINETKIVLVIGFFILGLLLVIISNSKVFSTVKKIINKINFLKKFSSSLDESRESLDLLNTKKNLAEATAFSIAAKIANLFTVYLIFLSYGIDLGLFLSGQIYYTSLILGVISFIPAGLIVTESSMLSLLIQHEVEFAIATLIVIFTRIITMWLTTFAGLFMLKFGFRNVNKNK